MPTNLRNESRFGYSQTREDAEAFLKATAVVVTPKRRGVLRFTVDAPVAVQKTAQIHSPPRWRTTEFYFYYVVFIVVVPMMVWKPISLSQESNPNYPLFYSRLSDGWIFGRKIDNSDAQFKTFRNNLPLLALIAATFLIIKYMYLKLFLRSSISEDGTRLHLIPFSLSFSIIFLLGLHGASVLKIFFILTINYGIAKSCKSSRVTPWLTWIFNMGVLFAIERNSGFQFSSLSPSLESLDRITGVYARWFIPFNFTMLRLVSFNMDFYWAHKASKFGQPILPDSAMDHKQRTTTPLDLDVYSYRNFLAYVLYPPLFLAGPIMTFNDFMWQHVRPSTVPTWKAVGRYFVRFCVCMLTMEFILHYMYVVAIKDTAAWKGDTPLELSMVGFWNLIIVWLKLLLPWRFFRLWALADGLEPQENMVRCMANNYSTLGFWRSWHRSFNLWIIRYIYIPLGGIKNQIVSTILIFTFVALWHDLTFRLLAWGWLVSFFIMPEVAARYILSSAKFGNYPWYRHVCAVGGVGNILMMLGANLVGFVIGVDGIQYMVRQLFGTIEGLQFLFVACACIFVGVQVMFEYREEEMRNGIYRKC
ncbi:MBOAT-domain-containing protein [Fomitiporia mediterranea MF3/22]|uniref:MBOAT-domain-containing protein n=1 Tax=Fomitiporia mediterranea (strain MF3/22) TaxID=694068 RepID=UPI0004409002|nr:MBOAT-domain-containing protein [Fomitiporia mediterranea MF3/22]EJD06915.1 MBOAT-domain-containing protein [Fomitiporia mediterranea MF3/22]